MVEELYTVFRQELLRWCVAMTGSGVVAEDLIQETFLRALGRLEDLEELSREQRRSWLYKTAKHLYIDRLRKLSREAPQEELAEPSLEEDLTAVAVRQLVDRLPGEERMLFTLRYFEGYNATELGELLDMPPSTVRAKLSAARRRLRQWWG